MDKTSFHESLNVRKFFSTNLNVNQIVRILFCTMIILYECLIVCYFFKFDCKKKIEIFYFNF